MSTESVPVRLEQNGLVEFDEEKLREEFRQWREDRLFFEAHQSEWHKQYPDMYVAVYREELAAVAPTTKELAEQLWAKDIRPDICYWQFLPIEHIILAPANRMILDE